ncbi:MAG: hypothetical protein V3T83_17980 [Acidobacteriota bacterium]
MDNTQPPIACNLAILPPAERERHEAVTRQLYSLVEDVRELPDGLELYLSSKDTQLLTEWISRERLCCPFLRFELRIEPQLGPVTLRLSGPEGTKEVLKAAILQL